MKNMALIISLFTLSTCAMESENKWNITIYGANINLYKKDILEHYADENNKIDIVICMGQYKQEELGVVPVAGNLPGHCCEQQTVTFRPAKNSIHYQKALSNDWYFSREGIQFLVVTEPRVFNLPGQAAQYWYSDSECYTKEEAIQESCKDLLRCYNVVLHKGIELLKEKNIKNIALPMLGADSHYEHARMFKDDVVSIAVNSVIEFLKNHRDSYKNIELFVEEIADCDLYKKLLIESYNKEKNIPLIWFAHQKDLESMFVLLPLDVIGYIAKLV